MERAAAVRKLRRLIGKDLRVLADAYEITVWKDGKENKGWAGHVIERYLGLPLNSSRSPNFGSWELKVVPIRVLADGSVKIKETMAITMIDPVEVARKPFRESHVFGKLQKLLVVARTHQDDAETSALVYKVGTFDLGDKRLFAAVKRDYDLVRRTIRRDGFDALSGGMGVVMQPRTKGSGHGSTSRAFYARKVLVAHMLGLELLDD